MSNEKKALEAFKGDEFMALKYKMMKSLEVTSEVNDTTKLLAS